MSAYKLAKAAAVGGVVVLVSATYFKYRIHANFTRQGFYKESLEVLAGYGPAKELLGTPIKSKQVDLGNCAQNYTDGYKAKVAIPLVGSKTKATLHAWSVRQNDGSNWVVSRADLELQSGGQVWTFYLLPQLHKVFDTDDSSSTDTSHTTSHMTDTSHRARHMTDSGPTTSHMTDSVNYSDDSNKVLTDSSRQLS